MPNHTSLASLFGDIADAIRAKTGGSGQIVADQFPQAISAITDGAVGTATSTRTSTTVISFSVAGAPKAFFVYPQYFVDSADITDQPIVSVIYDGTSTDTMAVSITSNKQSAMVDHFNSPGVTWSYGNGLLTLTATDNVRYWATRQYNIVYVY